MALLLQPGKLLTLRLEQQKWECACSGLTAVSPPLLRRKIRYQSAPRNIYRHIILSEMKEATAALPLVRGWWDTGAVAARVVVALVSLLGLS